MDKDTSILSIMIMDLPIQLSKYLTNTLRHQ